MATKPVADRSTVAEILRSRIEPTAIPDAILAYWRERDGKPYTKRDLDRLRAVLPEADINDSVCISMSSIVWGGYHRTGGRQGGSLLFSYADKGRTIDAAFLREKNPAYFSARDERNARRTAALANPALLSRAQALIEAHDAITEQLAKVRAEIDELIEYDGPLGPDRYEIERRLGVREEK